MCAVSLHSILHDRHVLVTGAGGGIGRAIVRELAGAGASVVGVDLLASGDVFACDVTDEEEVSASFDTAGDLTDVVHAAGVISLGAVRDLELAEWRRVLDVNLTGSFLVAREAARRLAPGGTVTLLSSQAGKRGGALWSAYCASKFGVVGLGQCLAQELAPSGVRVNVLCPGSVETSMTEKAIGTLAELKGQSGAELRASYEQAIPIGRFAEPAEIGRLCVLLLSDLSSYVTGASIVADGGELTA